MWWRETSEEDAKASPIGYPLIGLIGSLLAISYLQLVLGAQIRHVQPTTPPSQFTMTVAQHVMTALLLWLLSLLASWRLRRCGDLTLSRPGLVLVGLVSLQIVLGVATWVVNYGWPGFLGQVSSSSGYLIQAKGFVDSIIVTAHVAVGSLILAVSTMLLVRTLRVRDRRRQARGVRVDIPETSDKPVTSSAALSH
jgi:cytochrome c oxidase assembly protein subunit 15